MCAEYNLKTSDRDLSLLLEVSILNDSGAEDWDQHVRLFNNAPVLWQKDGEVHLEEMHFSLHPPGGRIPFTANARLDDWDERKEDLTLISDRPTWREALRKRRCVIPVLEFIEPIYRGEHAGQMMGFAQADGEVQLIAGIFEEGVNKQTGEVFRGFAMLTDFAHPFVAQVGHHRTVIALSPEAARHWIDDKPMDGVDAVKFLLRHKSELVLDARAVRTMKGWKARVANNQSKFLAEERIQPLVEEARRRRGLV